MRKSKKSPKTTVPHITSRQSMSKLTNISDVSQYNNAFVFNDSFTSLYKKLSMGNHSHYAFEYQSVMDSLGRLYSARLASTKECLDNFADTMQLYSWTLKALRQYNEKDNRHHHTRKNKQN